MKKNSKYLIDQLNSVNSRIDIIVQEVLDEMNEEELLYINKDSPEVWFIASNPDISDDSEIGDLIEDFDGYNTFKATIKHCEKVTVFNNIEEFRTTVNNIYSSKNGHIESDILTYTRYERILIVFLNMDAH